MDWNLAISRNRDALRRIVAALFVMIGSNGAGKMPRHVYAAIMLILRPAESAVRRLIVIAARGLALSPRALRPLPAGLAGFGLADASKTPSFCLFDPLKHFVLDDYDNNALPRFSFAGLSDDEHNTPHFSQPDVPVDAAHLFTRLRALRSALNDLPLQARRLARWQARQILALKSNTPYRPMRISPFRPGPPPGYRRKDIHQVDAVLKDLHNFAVEAFRWKPGDSCL